MHRTEGSGNVNNLFTDGPPATCVEQNIMNALQEEICNVIEGSGLTLLTAATDTRNQLLEAINLIFSGGTSYGFLNRANFTYKDTDEIYLDSGIYHHYGTLNQIIKWDERLTFKFGPGGSNPNNSALADNSFYYLYLDDSAIVSKGNNIITASELLAITTAPTWNNAKHGWYNGLDRCIFCIFSDASSNIEEFYITDNFIGISNNYLGGKAAKFDQDYSCVTVNTIWDDVYIPIPDICNKALISIRATYIGGTSYASYRTNASGASGVSTCGVNVNSQEDTTSIIIFTDENGIFEIINSADVDNQITISFQGYFLPNGM